MSFAWSFQVQTMTQGADGLYYNRESIRYRRIGVEGQYTFEQVTSVLEDTSHVHQVPSQEAKGVVGRALDYIELQLPPEVHAILNARPVNNAEEEDKGSQSSRIIAETPETMD